MDDRAKQRLLAFLDDVIRDGEQLVGELRGDRRALAEDLHRKATLARAIVDGRADTPQGQAEEIRRVMREIVLDEPNITATALAEQAADELEMDEALDDADHEIWDIAIDIVGEGR